MADVTAKVAQIRSAVLGIDVREDIALGIEGINTEVISTTAKQTTLETTFDALVINAGSSNAEVVAARGSAVSLPVRLSGVDAQLALSSTKDELTIGLQSLASGSPKTDYATLALLQAGIPAGNTSTYLTTDGNWNRWNGTAWVVGGVYQAIPLDAGRSIWQNSENIGNSLYGLVGFAVKVPTKTIIYKGITLSGVSINNGFYDAINSNLTPGAVPKLEAGSKYIASAYIKNISSTERFFWCRPLVNSSSNGHGTKFVDSVVRRFFWLFTADSTTTPQPYWMNSGSTSGVVETLLIGGCMMEQVSSTVKHGVACIGDSTMAGSSNKVDLPASKEWTRWAEGLMSIPFYNRGVGGQGTQQMIDRWATDMTPLFTDCKYAIINAGINDLLQTEQYLKDNLTALYNLAVTDGFIPIMSTITPCNKTDVQETTRLNVNTWIKQTFSMVMDFAKVIANPTTPAQIRNATDTNWYGDGTHFGSTGKRALGNYIASWPHWDFVLPSPYQPVLATTPKLMLMQDLLTFRPEPWPQKIPVWTSDLSIPGNGILSPSN